MSDFFDSISEQGESSLKLFGAILAVLACFTAGFTALAAWVTHVVICIKTTSWILLVFGIIVPPIGLIHGFGTWFGWFN